MRVLGTALVSAVTARRDGHLSTMQIRAIDTETHLMRPGLMAPPMVCLSYSHGRAAHSGLFDKRQGLDAAEKYLESDYIVGANIAYDLGVLGAERPGLLPLIFKAYAENRVTDVLIRQKLINIARGKHRTFGKYSLDTVYHALTDKHLEKEDTWRKRYKELDGIPIKDWPEEAFTYAVDDSEATEVCYWVQEDDLREIKKIGLLDDQHRQARAAFGLHLMSAWGIRTDAEGVRVLREGCEKKLEELTPGLLDAELLQWKKVKGVQTLGRKTRVAQARMVAAMGGYKKCKLTKTGKQVKRDKGEWAQVKYVSVDAESCTDSGDMLLINYAEYTTYSTLLNGHVKAMEEGLELPLHSFFEVLMDTGRTSSSGPNLQNIRRAKGARECFMPRPGMVYVACDYNKAELHTLAQTCIDIFKRSDLADALNSGYDPHLGLGAKLAKMTYEEALDLAKADDETIAEWRQRAKAGNFGFPGGMGPRGMVGYAKSTYGVAMSMEDSQELYTGWQEQWPVVQEYLAWVKNLCGADGFAFIEHFTSKRTRGRVPFTVAANSFFQGRAADGAKKALFEIQRRCYSVPSSALYGCRMVNFIHDEFLLEALADRASDAAYELRDVMVEEFNNYTPDVPVSAEPVIMDRWSKKAKTIVKPDGSLGVWKYAA